MSTASGDEYLVADSAVLPGEQVRAIPDRAPRLQWPFLLVALLVVAALAFIATGSLAKGVAGLAAAFGLAAGLRLVLPSRTAGWLASRSRTVDTCCLAALAGALAGMLLLIA